MSSIQQTNQIQTFNQNEVSITVSNSFTNFSSNIAVSNSSISKDGQKVTQNKKIDTESLVHSKNVKTMIQSWVGDNCLSTKERQLNIINIIKGKQISKNIFLEYFTYNTSLSKKGWWNSSFRKDGLVCGYSKHMLIISMIAEIAGIRFDSFETFAEFSSKLYYLTKNRKDLGDYVTNSESMELTLLTFGPKVQELFTKLILTREKRFKIFQQRFVLFERHFDMNFRGCKKIPSVLINHILEFLGFNVALEFVACEHCLRNKKSIDVALNHTSSKCKSGCFKCKMYGRPREIYIQHQTENCTQDNGCQYCSLTQKQSKGHSIYACKFLRTNSQTFCGDCSNYGCKPHVYRSHDLSSCRFVKYCAYCYSINKTQKVFNSHTIANCRKYRYNVSYYYSHMNKLKSKSKSYHSTSHDSYCLHSDDFFRIVDKDFNTDDNYYEDEDDYLLRTNPGYARYMDSREDHYSQYGYYESDFESDDNDDDDDDYRRRYYNDY